MRKIVITVLAAVGSAVFSGIATAVTLQLCDLPFLMPAFALAIGLPLLCTPAIVWPLMSANERLRRMKAELERLALTDMLTDLPNRRAFFAGAEARLAAASEQAAPIAAMMIDIDRFKRINDTYGHDAGDAVIRRVAQTIRATLGTSEGSGHLLARLGGEEFAVLVVGMAADDAVGLAERIRLGVRAAPSLHDGVVIGTTVSIGVAWSSSDEIDALLSRADDAVYQSKRQGRDCVTLASDAIAGELPPLSRAVSG